MADAAFRAKAPDIMRRLMVDLALTEMDAAAILGNIGVECGSFTLRLEKGKTTYDTTGFGWCQWTNTRRRDLDKWCAEKGYKPNGTDPEYDAACYAFLVHELKNTWEKRALLALRAASSLEAKTLSFMKLYERPGVPHQDRRVSMAHTALEEFRKAGIAPAPAAKPTPTVPKEAPVMSTVPAEWMPDVKMKGIVIHWTAGAHKANSTDRSHYHVLVEGDGSLVRGDHSIADNVNTGDGKYAAHTRGCNTGFIGVSMCAMMGAQESPFVPGPAPLTIVQWAKMTRVVGDLCKRYGIPVTPKTVLSHAEVQSNLGIEQAGKWDITRIAFDPKVIGAKACGDKLRADVRAAMGAAPVVTVPTAAKVGTGIVIVVGTATAGGAWYSGIDWLTVGLIAGGALLIAAVIISIARRH